MGKGETEGDTYSLHPLAPCHWLVSFYQLYRGLCLPFVSGEESAADPVGRCGRGDGKVLSSHLGVSYPACWSQEPELGRFHFEEASPGLYPLFPYENGQGG